MIEVHGPDGMTCMIDLNPLQTEVEIITKSIVEMDSNISVGNAKLSINGSLLLSRLSHCI